MANAFNDAIIFREISQWRAVFATPSVETTNEQLFANFGSIEEDSRPTRDPDSLISSIAERFACDVYGELSADLKIEGSRSSKTQNGRRQPIQKPYGLHHQPTITPKGSRKGPRTVTKDRFT